MSDSDSDSRTVTITVLMTPGLDSGRVVCDPKTKMLGCVRERGGGGGGGGVVTCDHSGLHIFLIFEPIFGTVTLLKSSDDDWTGQRLGLGASLSARRAAAAAAASSRELSVPLQTGVQKRTRKP